MPEPGRPIKLDSIDQLKYLIFDIMADGVIVIDQHGYIIECNTSFHQRLGYEKHEVIGKSVKELDPPEFAVRVPERIKMIHDQGHAVFETAHYRKDGSIMPIELNARFISIGDEHYFFSIVRDISERKRMDKALQQQERMYRAVVETSIDGFWTVDSNGRIIQVNDAYVLRSGYSREELLQMHISDLEAVESNEATRAHIEKIIRDGHDRFESHHKTKDGEIWPVEVVTTFWPFENGRFFVFIVDISERKRAEQEMQTQQRELRKLSEALEQAGEGIIITNPQAIIEYVNPAYCDITGYSNEESLGCNISILLGENREADTYIQLQQTISHGGIWKETLVNRRKDGSIFPGMISIAPVYDQSSHISHYVAVLKDVTELKKMEGQLVQAQKMESMGTLVGGIAHDFNNMLSALQGNVYIANRHINDQEIIRQRLETIDELSEQASSVVKQLLTFAKKDIIDIETVDLNNQIRHGFQLARSTIPENIEHHLNVCDDQLFVDMDATQLQQVLINLSNNARDALEHIARPRIEWHLEKFTADKTFENKHTGLQGSEFALISVRDNGQGIKASHLEAIFDPFFTTKPPGKGTGLGLAMVFGAIQRHGGLLEVESEEQKGSTFKIYLPLSKPAQTIASAYELPEAVAGNHATILLVDDEETVRITIAEVLKEIGYTPMEACNGEEALEVYRQHQDQIALILSDIVMPGMGGIEMAREIRQRNAQVPIILVTGYDRDQAKLERFDLNGCMIMNKPYSFKLLSQNIQQMIQQSKS